MFEITPDILDQVDGPIHTVVYMTQRINIAGHSVNEVLDALGIDNPTLTYGEGEDEGTVYVSVQAGTKGLVDEDGFDDGAISFDDLVRKQTTLTYKVSTFEDGTRHVLCPPVINAPEALLIEKAGLSYPAVPTMESCEELVDEAIDVMADRLAELLGLTDEQVDEVLDLLQILM